LEQRNQSVGLYLLKDNKVIPQLQMLANASLQL
jgi:hypothetical protein